MESSVASKPHHPAKTSLKKPRNGKALPHSKAQQQKTQIKDKKRTMRSVLQKAPTSMGSPTQSNDVIRIWKAFVNGGLTSQFLTDLLRLKDRSGIAELSEASTIANPQSFSGKKAKMQSSMKRRPCADFQLVVENGLRSLVEEPEGPDVKEKILVSCLTAIKGVYFKSQAKTAVEDLLLASSRVVNASHTLTEQQKITLTEAMTSLLSNQHPLAYLEKILQKDGFLLRQDHDQTSPYPLGTSQQPSKVSRKARTTVRAISPSQSEPSSSSNMKLVSLLTFKSYEIFPFLMKLKIEESVWKKYVQDLIDAEHRFSVLKAIQLNPDQVGLTELKWLERIMKENNDWESFAELLGYIFHVRKSITDKLNYKSVAKVSSDRTSGSKRNSAGLTSAENIKNSNLVKRVADSIILRDGRSGMDIFHPKNSEHSLLTLPEATFLELMESFLAECISVDSTLSLRAAAVIVTDFSGYCSMNEEKIKSFQLHRKLNQFVIKDKWLLAAQTSHSLVAKESLYKVLQENGKYLEAKTFYDQFGLAPHFPPVDEEKIEQQKLTISQYYLMFPSAKSKIIFVDSLQTIMYMAKVLGVSSEIDRSETSGIDRSMSMAINGLNIEQIIEATQQSFLQFKTINIEESSTTISEEDSVTAITSKSKITNQYWVPSNSEGFRNVVGIDAEWRVEMYVNNSNEGAGILQIASPGHVFVVDLYQIGSADANDPQQVEVLNTTVAVIRNIFADKQLLKLGFDFYLEDMKMIKNAGRGAFENAIGEIESLLDIQSAVRSRIAWLDLENPNQAISSKNVASLSEVCKRYLGKPLLKTSQISDWKKRPLGQEQLHYASLDAHCLIGILDALLLEKGIDCGLQVALGQYNIQDWIASNLETMRNLETGKINCTKNVRDQDLQGEESEEEEDEDT